MSAKPAKSALAETESGRLGVWAVSPFQMPDMTAGRPARNPMEMWLSLFPTSSFFGVRWFWADFVSNAKDANPAKMFGGAPMMPSLTPGAAGAPFGVGVLFGFGLGGAGASQNEPKTGAVAEAREDDALSMSGRALRIEPAEPVETAYALAEEQPQEVAVETKLAAPSAAARAEAESAVLDGVAAPQRAELSAVGGVTAAFTADTEEARPAKAKLRVVGGLDEEADTATQAATAPKNLFKKAPASVDNLKLIRGVGPRLEELLNELGVYTFQQIADFSENDYAWLDEHLGTFKGRGVRDKWSEQAQELLAG